jgi:hypothetical protein
MGSLKFRVNACPQVGKASKVENEQIVLKQAIGREKLLVKP